MNKSTLTLLTALQLVRLAAVHAARSGLIAHWNFDEGRGHVARDVSGHGHDATLKNVEWVSDPYELRHVTDPDFEQGTAHWQIAAAEAARSARPVRGLRNTRRPLSRRRNGRRLPAYTRRENVPTS